jgi:hypothetical protein
MEDEIDGLITPPASNSQQQQQFAPPSIGTMGSIGSPSSENDAVTWRNFICRSSHPVAAFFHVAFKGAAVALYLTGSWFSVDDVSIFISMVLCLACDFWAVKNVTGRLLVGLRWHAVIKDDGTTVYVFESLPPSQAKIVPLDYRIFWWALYLTPVVFIFFAFMSLLKLSFFWLLVDVVAVALTGTNLIQYNKCSADAQRRITSAVTSGLVSTLSAIPGGAASQAWVGGMIGSIAAAAMTGGSNAAANTGAGGAGQKSEQV